MVERQELDWRTSAACRNSSYPSLFDPLPGGIEEQQALAVCQNCPVTRQCWNDAMQRRDVVGIRGGVPGRHREHVMRAKNLRRWRARQSQHQTNSEHTVQVCS